MKSKLWKKVIRENIFWMLLNFYVSYLWFKANIDELKSITLHAPAEAVRSVPAEPVKPAESAYPITKIDTPIPIQETKQPVQVARNDSILMPETSVKGLINSWEK